MEANRSRVRSGRSVLGVLLGCLLGLGMWAALLAFVVLTWVGSR